MSSGARAMGRSGQRGGGRTVPRSSPRLTGRAAVLVAVVLVLAMSLIVPLRQYAAQRARVAGLEEKVASLNSANARLERQIERLKDPKYLERLARECIGMVKPGEIAFVTVPKDGGRPGPGPDC